MSNNYELPPNPPSGGSGIEPSAIDKLIISLKETNPMLMPLGEENAKKEFFCPFRKRTFFMDCDEKESWPTTLEQAYYMEEDFLPCLQEACMMYHGRDGFGYCGMQSL